MKLSPITPGPHALHDLIRPAGSAPIPLDFEAAEALDAQARAAYARALELTQNQVERAFLQKRLDALVHDDPTHRDTSG